MLLTLPIGPWGPRLRTIGMDLASLWSKGAQSVGRVSRDLWVEGQPLWSQRGSSVDPNTVIRDARNA